MVHREYLFEGMICFVGAHYFIFIRNHISHSLSSSIYSRSFDWKLYDDDIVRSYADWYDVVKECIELKAIPTVLLFQKSKRYETERVKLGIREVGDLDRRVKYLENRYERFESE